MSGPSTLYAMPKIGDVVAGKYRLEKVAGEGGMGIVYAAEHLVLKQRVAVKVLLPDAALSEATVERFAREARAAAKINSEHVARVLDAGALPSGALFLVMEFLEGCDLEELMDLQETLSVHEIVDYLIQALEGLAHAHAANIIHRDLKPANLFLACRPDGSNAIKLLDFGISKMETPKPEDKRLTGQHVLGSPVYMSPEQLRNAADLDARADLWSIGVVGYELLAGVPPFDGEGVGEIFAAILEKSPRPLTELNPEVPDELAGVLSRCLRRDPEERWADAAELARALAPFSTDPDHPAVERAEQVLVRSRMMTVPKTPVETMQVLEAIEAAAHRLTTATRSFPAMPPASERTRRNRVRRGIATRAVGFVRRSPGRAMALVAGLAVVFGLVTFGAGRASRSSAAAAAAAAAPHATAALAAAPSPTVAQAPFAMRTAEPEPAASDAPEGADSAPLVMDLPPNGSAQPATSRTHGAKPSGKPQRPKFLNTRE